LDVLEQQAADQDVLELHAFTALRTGWRELDASADALGPSALLMADHETAVSPIPVRVAADDFGEEHGQVERAFLAARDVALREKSLDSEVQRMRRDITQEEKYLEDARKASAANRVEAELLAKVVDEGKAVVAAADAARATTERHLITAESYDARAEKVGDLWADAGQYAELVDEMALKAKGIEAHYVHLIPLRKKFEAKIESVDQQQAAHKKFRNKMREMNVVEILMRPSPEKKKEWTEKAASTWMSKALHR
jgi:predicted ribosome quality control (RQC) complex YloA/Tae2 family protein